MSQSPHAPTRPELRPESRPVIRLADYAPPPYLIDEVELEFHLAPKATRVRSRIAFRPNPAREGRNDLRLDGEALRLISARVDGAPISAEADAKGLTLPAAALPDGAFLFEAEVEIDPEANTRLEGLYLSKGMFCTQCEAEGFRRITFYPDRPDVMARFTVRIHSELPVLLSNGNLVAERPGFAEWHDPHPKPAYLFALVAGDLVATHSRFTTASGREVGLGIWVRPGDEDRTAFAMDALKASMAWDEENYGREYDLDLFNIVAVDDFNMGAMENKGLNIFNARYVLASPETATDADYAAIDRIIAHEYFHNWTGNRITCRDWFQLSLKEGLTVFRDQQYGADRRGEAVVRIAEVANLRARQFREDAGPLAHPVRPQEYEEINNFYTATVYDKGAEVIRMLRALVGPEGYRAALDLYFRRHDGEACTIEDWLKVFEDATGRDLSQFRLWYSQAGTPRLEVQEEWDGANFRLRLRQHLPETPGASGGQGAKQPQLIPLALGLIGANGGELKATEIVEVDTEEMVLEFPGLPSRPTPSLLRGFSAPVLLDHRPEPGALAHLLAHDTDPVARWDAGRRLGLEVAEAALRGGAADPDWLAGLAAILRDETLEPAYRAQMLALPGEEALAGHLAAKGSTPDPEQIHTAREGLRRALAAHLAPELAGIAEAPAPAFENSPESAGLRALRGAALGLHSLNDGGKAAQSAFAAADNMTDQIAALSALAAIGGGAAALADFHAQWQQDPLVLDKWYTLQAGLTPPETAAETVAAIAAGPDFDWGNPNRFRALFGGFAGNHAGFHRKDGAGYRLLADWLLKLDARNPQFAARMSGAFETWARYDAGRQALARGALKRLAAREGASSDIGEMVARMLG